MNPTDDMPSCESEQCDYGCREPWASEIEGVMNGPRKLRLCEAHVDAWLRGETELAAEREAVARRTRKARREELAGHAGLAKESRSASYADLYGLARALEAWRVAPKRRRSA